MIAAGCDAISDEAWNSESDISPSFLARARPLIGNAQISLTWGSDEKGARFLDGRDYYSALAFPRARYLSQQFVEELCSSKGASEGLVREIERVIYEAHAARGDEGAYSFEQLREQRTFRHRQARRMESEALAALSDRIAVEFEKEASVGPLAAQVAAKEKLIIGYSADLAKLIIKGGEAHVQRYSQLSEAAQTLTTRCNAMANQRRTFLAMQDEVANTRTTKAPEMLRQVVDRHPASGLSSQQWNEFLLVYQGNVDKALSDYIVWADQEMAKMVGDPVTVEDPNIALIAQEDDLSKVQMSFLKAEMARLEKLISADKLVRDQYTTLSKKIATEKASLQQLQTRWDDAKGAADRRKSLQIERDATYGRLMAAIIDEQKELADLYVPLMERISTMYGTLKKLSFRVSRTADVAQWARTGEEDLIDCRKSGDFYGRGSLEKIACAQLQSAWERGSAGDVQATLGKFWVDYSKAFLAQAPVVPAEQEAFRKWSLLFAHWLFSTDHIAVKYEILYDGVDIRKLSPGTRGIVLLLLYLALDDVDDRPLIIDQPEENLDPKSVFDELVSLFISAKGKRQVIMVTHNANLVINTDADQIIIANASPAEQGGLPSFTYTAGGMEDSNIRKTVCEILEGGEIAFKERARRLRVRFGR